jgi:hypothetical protein
MNTNQKLHQARLSEWAVRFQEQAKCGLTVKDWCVENGFTVHTFYYWKHLLKEEYAESVLPDIVPIHTTQTNPSASLSVSSDIHPLTFNSSSALHNSHKLCNSDSICMTIGDIRIDIGPSASDELILRLIKAVRYA